MRPRTGGNRPGLGTGNSPPNPSPHPNLFSLFFKDEKRKNRLAKFSANLRTSFIPAPAQHFPCPDVPDKLGKLGKLVPDKLRAIPFCMLHPRFGPPFCMLWAPGVLHVCMPPPPRCLHACLHALLPILVCMPAPPVCMLFARSSIRSRTSPGIPGPAVLAANACHGFAGRTRGPGIPGAM